MIELIRIDDFNDLRECIEIAYRGDDELLSKYHVDKYSLEEAVNETMRMIVITSKEAPMINFAVVNNGEKIGYLSIFTNNLYSFGINIEKRTKEVLIEFWEIIKQVLGTSFITMLYPNNIRAINWLKKCGMVEVPEVEENCVVLLYNEK